MKLDDSLLSLVKIKNNSWVGSGVWFDLDNPGLSIVVTAKHNIKKRKDVIDITDFKGNKLSIIDQEICQSHDIAYFVIDSDSNNLIELCRDVSKAQAITYGYPQALATQPKKHHGYEGDIYYEPDHDTDNLFYLNITKGAPSEPSADYIKGFSGGPVFEIENEVVKLRGIVTHKFDKDFNIAKIQCHKVSTVLDLINGKYETKNIMPAIDNALFEEIYLELGEDLEDAISETKISDIIYEIDTDKFIDKYFLSESSIDLKVTQSSSDLRLSLKKLIKSKAISLIYCSPDTLMDINSNPTVGTKEKKRMFSIKISDDIERTQILRSFMERAEALNLNNSIVITFREQIIKDFEYLDKKTISRTLENYSVRGNPLLDKLSKKERREAKTYYEKNHNKKVAFSILDLDWLLRKTINLIENNVLTGMEVTTSMVFDEIKGIINDVDRI